MTSNNKYAQRYLPLMQMAVNQTRRSNDSDRVVGAFFVRDRDLEPVAGGANRVLLSYTSNAEKQLVTIHAERMAIQAARDNGWTNLSQLTLLVTRHPCANCLMDIWLSGCRKVVYIMNDESKSKWRDSFLAAKALAEHFNILLIGVVWQNGS